MLAPLIVFAYNRPELLQKTITGLGNNILAAQTDLFVYCDGAKNDADSTHIAKINEVRAFAHQINNRELFNNVSIIERESNMGLGSSIITGVTEVIKQYGKCIVMEDDLESSPFFLSYMNQCLDFYQSRKSVFSISATSRPHPERFYPKDYPYDVYVSLTHRPTGWATWQDRWEQVDWTASAYKTLRGNIAMKDAFNRLGADYFDALVRQQDGNENLWSIRFALSHFVNHAISICPIVSYINHIGWGDDATNSPNIGGPRWYSDKLADNKDLRLLDILYEDSRILNAWYSFSVPSRRTLFGRLKNWFGRRFLNKDEFSLKGRIFY